jgi:hypothetical protein
MECGEKSHACFGDFADQKSIALYKVAPDQYDDSLTIPDEN